MLRNECRDNPGSINRHQSLCLLSTNDHRLDIIPQNIINYAPLYPFATESHSLCPVPSIFGI